MLSLEQIERITDNYLDELIKELNEKEEKERELIKHIYKNKSFIFDNLNNKNISFDFEIIEVGYQDENFYSCDIYTKYNDNNLFLTKDYFYEDYTEENFLTLEEINKIKEYKRIKDKENQKENEENLESEF